ncbi:hypothetical protein FACS1894185_6670 [Betaproteobacteria bacterium]|nr:hypothetical protein FACS1894185_6670 [Betaproteobacteria bacterium]GHU15963.1 hypothetical protein FACS189441_8100 [Betaproteobacteria bacterium]
MMIKNDVAKFEEMRRTDYSYLKAISFVRDFDESSAYRGEIVLASLDENGDMLIEFANAIGVKIGNITHMHGVLVEIEDVSSWQWEGVLFRIRDVEEDTFSFLCGDFSVEIVDRKICTWWWRRQ